MTYVTRALYYGINQLLINIILFAMTVINNHKSTKTALQREILLFITHYHVHAILPIQQVTRYIVGLMWD